MSNDANISPEQLEWLQLREDLAARHEENTQARGWEKLKIKCLENPFVPIGAALTTGAITMGLIAMARGQKRMSQLMMRARVGCQAFAIISIVVGLEIKRRRALTENVAIKNLEPLQQ